MSGLAKSSRKSGGRSESRTNLFSKCLQHLSSVSTFTAIPENKPLVSP